MASTAPTTMRMMPIVQTIGILATKPMISRDDAENDHVLS